MTVREIAEGVAQAHGLDMSSKAIMNKLGENVRAALFKPREGVVREEVDGVYRWRAA